MAQKPTPPYVSLPAYWDGIAEALGARLAASKAYLQHPVAGFSAEGYFKELLREYLPKRYAVETGFIIDSSGRRSQHIDIVIADTLHIPPLSSEPTYKVFAAESVCAAIEVTTSPRGREKQVPKFHQDVAKLAGVRALCAKREYFELYPVKVGTETQLRPVPFVLTGSPRVYMVTSGDEWRQSETYQDRLVSALRKVNSKAAPTWINAVLSLQHGLLRFKPYTSYESSWQKENALLNFLLLLNQDIATFATFKVDIKRYAKNRPRP